jgi:uncharacterized delta-60 repeat protein
MVLMPLHSLAITQVDATFGDAGVAVKDFGFGDDEALDVVIQADGKFVVAGYSFNGAVKNLAVARYLPTGELDPEFDNDGIATLSMGSGDTVATSLVLQDDGRIILAGVTQSGDYTLLVARLTGEGNLDNSFGDGGHLIVPFDDGDVQTAEVQITGDGKIVVAGTLKAGESATHSYCIKVTGQGLLDASFGESGVTLIKQEGNSEVNGVALQGDGRVMVAGSLVSEDVPRAALMRLNANGTIDESFGEQGILLLDLEGNSSAVNDIYLDATGNILVTGYTHDSTNFQTFIGKLGENGEVASDLGPGGYYRSRLSFWNMGNAITVLDNGDVLVTGVVGAQNGSDIFLVTVSESEDTAAGDSGEQAVASSMSATALTIDVQQHDDVSNASAAVQGGKVIVAGSSHSGSDLDFALVMLSSEPVAGVNGEFLSTKGVTTSGFHVVTRPITNILPLSATSGGEITQLEDTSCEESCTEECAESTVETCLEDCQAECTPSLTVTRLGVCFNVNPNPELGDGEDGGGTDPADPTDPAGSTDSSASTDSTDSTDSTTGGGVFPESSLSNYVVREGCTEDGDELGEWISDLEDITPSTWYWVRAYAELSDGTVIYGNELGFKTKDSCFIATAAYGSILDRHVEILREFRDSVLMSSRGGQFLIGFYYQVSPGIATVIAQSDMLRWIVRVALMPVVLSAYILLKAGYVAFVCLMLAAAGSLLLSFKFLRRT